jgi:hypothetical protein
MQKLNCPLEHPSVANPTTTYLYFTASPPPYPGWTFIVSAYLSHLYSLYLETSHLRNKLKLRPSSLLAAAAVLTRVLGKSLAAANAVFIVASAVIQFTGLYDNCWCDACIPSLRKNAGWIVTFASDAQIAPANKSAWFGGVFMGILVSVAVSIWGFLATGEEVFGGSEE